MPVYSDQKAKRRRELRKQVGQPRSELKRVSFRVLCHLFPFLLDCNFRNSDIKSARFRELDDRIFYILGPHTPLVSEHGSDPVQYLKLVLDSRGINLDKRLLEQIVYRDRNIMKVDTEFLNEVIFGTNSETAEDATPCDLPDAS